MREERERGSERESEREGVIEGVRENEREKFISIWNLINTLYCISRAHIKLV